MIDRDDDGYTLSTLGLAYADRVNEERQIVYQQPKIITMFVIQNSDGDILLQKRTKQPYIDTWNLPNGKLHIDDDSLAVAAQQLILRKLNVKKQDSNHAGDCYIRVSQGDAPISVTLAHIFTFNRDNIQMDNTQWVQPHKLHKLDLAPAVEQIVARTFFRDLFFFEEFEESW
jgi:ADP-ribose pyrophosphatase YjhB (NUDIX family)